MTLQVGNAQALHIADLFVLDVMQIAGAIEESLHAIAASFILEMDRGAVRKQFEARFTARRMALDYLAAYRSLMEKAEPRLKLVSSAE